MATKIFHDDIIFATVSQRGNIIVSLKMTGLTSIRDLLELLNKTINGYMGMVMLKLRNKSQGWSLNQPIMMGRKASSITSGPVQLTLF